MLSKRILVLMFVVAFLPLLVGCFPPPPTNQTPIITSIPITTATVGVLYTYDVNATDPDGDTLTYSLALNPSGMTINSKTGVIKWTPTSTQIGSNSVTVMISDGIEGIPHNFKIKVSKPSAPPAAELTGIEVSPDAMTLLKGVSQQLTVIAHYSDKSTVDITSYCIYKSSDKSTALVSVYGLVTTKGFNKTIITVTYTPDGKVFNYKVVVTVVETIQEAIDAALAGDTIEVPAGIYNECVDINKSLTLQGENRETTEIKFGYDYYPSEPPLTISADGVTVSGFTIRSGPDIEPAWTIAVEGDSALFTDLNVIKESLLSRGRGGSAFWLAPGLENFTFTDSTIDSDWNGIYALEEGNDITVRNVDFTYPGEWGIFLKMTTGATVEGNIFTCTGHDSISADSQGIVISRGSTAIEIKENQFMGSYPIGARSHIGILLQDFKTGPVGVSILGNEISDFDTGIKIEENVAVSGISIHDNDIYDNLSYGVNCLGLDTVNAENNWWGDEGGPYHSTNPSGIGNAVSNKVDFDPWIH